MHIVSKRVVQSATHIVTCAPMSPEMGCIIKPSTEIIIDVDVIINCIYAHFCCDDYVAKIANGAEGCSFVALMIFSINIVVFGIHNYVIMIYFSIS